jgi:hypothetical protein
VTTRAERERLAKLAEDATNAPWAAHATREDGTAQVYATHLGFTRQCVPVCETTGKDAAFIAAARAAIPELLADVDRLRERLDLNHRSRVPKGGDSFVREAWEGEIGDLDGIACRDMTISLLEENVRLLHAARVKLRDALRVLAEAVGPVGDALLHAYERVGGLDEPGRSQMGAVLAALTRAKNALDDDKEALTR